MPSTSSVGRRAKFFSPDSFWNTPLPASPVVHERNAHFCQLMRNSTDGAGLHINLHAWTIPLVAVDASTPRVRVQRHFDRPRTDSAFAENSSPYLHPGHPFGHHAGFSREPVPVPPNVQPDQESDAHLALVDEQARLGWDMWAAERQADGTWRSCTGMKYSLDGPGVFDPAEFPIRNGESIHLYGPSRATGVPAIAGLILHDDVMADEIPHKLAFAIRTSGLLAHHFPPTIWTDGAIPNGQPAGIVVQLDPTLDLDAFPLTRGARAVARALQRYGAVLVDYASGFTLYGEGLWNDPRKRTWRGLLDEDALYALGFDHFRYIAPESLGQTLVEKGMVPMPHPLLRQEYSRYTGVKL